MKLLIATSNNGKLEEFKQILFDYELQTLNDINLKVNVAEDGKTFEENALKKAKEIALLAGTLCLADDSGLCVDALDGFPGIITQRFLGANSSDNERNMYIINKLDGLKKELRTASVTTCIALSNGTKSVCVSGTINGYISLMPRGDKGFGFDYIFELPNGKTLAELSSQEKNEVSSRRLALDKIKDKLKEF